MFTIGDSCFSLFRFLKHSTIQGTDESNTNLYNSVIPITYWKALWNYSLAIKKFDDGKGFLRCSPKIATEIHTDQRRIQDFPSRGRQRLNLGQKPIICKIFSKDCMKRKEVGPGSRPWRLPWIR